jgi:NAD(P)-dependent dehydrogenase (short-subunit alcohol dehydrogenase family)
MDCEYQCINDLFSLKNERAFVTGKVGLLAPVWKETLENAGAEVRMYGLPEDDVRDRDKLFKIAETYTPDILLNNCAIDNPPTSKATFFGNAKEILEVNLFGANNVCEAFIPKMIENGGGVIVFIGSIQGYGGSDYRNYPPDFEKPIAYGESKAAYRNMARQIAVQYGRYGIRAVTPSFSAYNGGKLKQEFLEKFLKNVPLRKQGYTELIDQCISKKSLQQTLLYAICCEDLTGQDWRVDGGLNSWA